MRRYFALATLTVGLVLSGAATAETVGIATSNPGSLFYNIGTAVAKAANAGGLHATIQPATSPNQYIPYVNSGGIQFGVGNLQEVNYGLTGEAWFEGQANPDLRIVAEIMPLREAIFVRKSSDIHSISDLKSKEMVDGYTAQHTILPQLAAMYATAGLTRDDMQSVEVSSVVAGANAFMSGQAAGFIFGIGASKVREADAKVGGLRALSIPKSEENLHAMRKHWPAAYLTRIEPGPNAPGVEEPAYYMAYPLVVFANKNVPDDVAYKMAKSLYKNKQVMVQTFAPFKRFKPEDMAGDTGVSQYHAGAIRFYKQVGIWKK